MRWYQVGQWIEDLLDQGLRDSVCEHYLSEFLEFLRSRGLAIQAVTGPLSVALAAYHQKSGAPLLEGRRIKSIEKLASLEELAPLVSLLRLMDLALNALPADRQVKFDSGKHHGGWVGYNINSMEYFFTFYLTEPEALFFETFGRVFVEEAWDRKAGETYVSIRKRRWRTRLDLASEPAFSGASERDQVAVLERFVRDGYEQAQRFTKPTPADLSASARETPG